MEFSSYFGPQKYSRLITGLRECVLIFVTTFVSNILLYLQYCPSFELARTEQNSPGLSILRLNDDLYIEFESCMHISHRKSYFCETAKINKMNRHILFICVKLCYFDNKLTSISKIYYVIDYLINVIRYSFNIFKE